MSSNELSAFLGLWLPRIEDEMRDVLQNDERAVAAHYGMMRYHLGWADEEFREQTFPAGKRLRPILCLLACAELGGDPAQALPAAAGIELLHNFSLIHDDIEDGDETRRGRTTVWKQWGMAQGINAGDGMFALAFAAVQRLARRGVPATTTLAALDVFTRTCVALTEGQHLDLGFEQRDAVQVEEYLRMIRGKTAALVGCSVAVGAIVAEASAEQSAALQRFGESVGLAFQIQDDVLGIWGDPNVTGKPAGNDVLRRKKSFPLLYALEHPETSTRMRQIFAEPVGPECLPEVLGLLERCGARGRAEEQVEEYHAGGLQTLSAALGARAENSPLRALADSLLYRDA
jgi:geranylgeranyl diphosphate synthase type I